MATYDDDVADGTIHELGINFDDNAQGFYVPRYVIEGDAERGIEPMAPDLVTVADLAKYPDVFPDPDENSKGAIYGAISGWQVDEIMRNKYEYYGLDEMFNYIDPGSQAAMEATIACSDMKKAKHGSDTIGNRHGSTGKYDLVLLEDAPYVDEEAFQAGETEFRSTTVTVAVSDDFYQKAPEYCEFLSNYHTSSALTAEALSYIQENDATYEEAAKWFLTENDALLNKFLPADKAAMVREDLEK